MRFGRAEESGGGGGGRDPHTRRRGGSSVRLATERLLGEDECEKRSRDNQQIASSARPTSAATNATRVRVLVLRCGILLALLSLCYTLRPAAVHASAAPSLMASDESADKCWIFTHLQNSGGSTVKEILKGRWCPQCGIYDSRHWKKGDGLLENIGQTIDRGGDWKVVAGGYTEALRRSDGVEDHCQWFTVFRHPISRMVSAYYYCKHAYKDQLCASKYLSADHADLEEFAKHWGNFAMRQFALSFVSPDDVMAFWRTDAAKGRLPPLSNRKVDNNPAWYILKVYLDDQTGPPDSDNENFEQNGRHDAALYEMLQPVQDLLRDDYAAVGILEEFNATLSLFDAALEMPGVDWHERFVREGKAKVNTRYAEEKAATLAEAWTNSEIKKYMQLDIMLYEHAVAVFHQQARAHGIKG